MKAIAVDDQDISLDIMKVQLERTGRFDEIHTFVSPQEAIAWTKEHPVDIAFLDIIMDELDGITLANAITAYRPNCKIVFTTSSKDYAFDAFKVHAFGYLVKPVTKEAINELLDGAERKGMPLENSAKGDPVTVSAQNTAAPAPAAPSGVPRPLRAQCFGNFAAFDSTGAPLSFTYLKTKELLAYLVHRNGDLVTILEIADAMFDESEDDSQIKRHIKNLINDLEDSLERGKVPEVLVQSNTGVAVTPSVMECDYYDFLNGKNKGAFHGEYMNGYDWAEPMCEYLKKDAAAAAGK